VMMHGAIMNNVVNVTTIQMGSGVVTYNDTATNAKNVSFVYKSDSTSEYKIKINMSYIIDPNDDTTVILSSYHSTDSRVLVSAITQDSQYTVDYVNQTMEVKLTFSANDGSYVLQTITTTITQTTPIIAASSLWPTPSLDKPPLMPYSKPARANGKTTTTESGTNWKLTRTVQLKYDNPRVSGIRRDKITTTDTVVVTTTDQTVLQERIMPPTIPEMTIVDGTVQFVPNRF